MAYLQIEQIINGVATGKYVRNVGSQFGSLWGFDGLLVAEATPEQYAAFGASRGVRLGHGEGIEWLNREWSVILVYPKQALAQVSAYTSYDDQLLSTVRSRLVAMLGKPKESSSDFVWVGRDGFVTLTKTPQFLQLDATRFTVPERLMSKLKAIF